MLLAALSLSAFAADSAFDSWSATTNPAQGSLGTWSYAYYDGLADTFTLLPSTVSNVPYRLSNWQIKTSVSDGKPRITANVGNADKTYLRVKYPISDWLVLRPNTNEAVLRFTADAGGSYEFDATFKPMGTMYNSSTVVSMESSGAVVGGCSGAVGGMLGDVGADLDCAGVVVALDAGESVDFVVDANGTTATPDDIGLMVDVELAGGGGGQVGACSAPFDDAYAILGEGGDPSDFYTGTVFACNYGLIGGDINGDSGNWSNPNTVPTAAWGCHDFGGSPGTISFDGDVTDVELDLEQTTGVTDFAVEGWRGGVLQSTTNVTVTGISRVTVPGTVDEISIGITSGGFAYGVDNLDWTGVCPL